MNTSSQFKTFLKSFTPYQIGYLVVVLLLTIGFTVFLPHMMLEDMSNSFVVVCSVIAVVANPVCELLISKQSKLNFMVDLFFIEIPELDPEDDMDSPEPPRRQPEEEPSESVLPVEEDDEDETLADGLLDDQLSIPGEEEDDEMEDFSVDDLGDMDLDDPLE